MKRIGLTGGFGSGKSTVVEIIRSDNKPIVDTDEIARSLVSPGSQILKNIQEQFGREIINNNGELDRKALARQVFRNPIALQKLNALMHPAVESMMNQELKLFEDAGLAWAIIDVPLLYEVGWDTHFDATIVVWAPPEISRKRLMEQRGFTAEEIDERFAAQRPLEDKRRQADYVIDNSGSLDQTREQTLAVLKKLERDFPLAP